MDLLLSIGRDGQLHTSLYYKRDDFNFHITHFPFMSSNILSSPAYCVFMSQLIRYARASSSYEGFILRAVQLSSNKLLGQGYLKGRLGSSLPKFYCRSGDLIKQYEAPLSQCYTTFWMMTIYSDTLHWSGITPILTALLILTLLPNLTFYLIPRGFLRAFFKEYFRVISEYNLTWLSIYIDEIICYGFLFSAQPTPL